MNSLINVISDIITEDTETESSWIFVWDSLISNPLKYWEPRIKHHRDTSKLSDTGRKRPDNIPLFNNKALFHGEKRARNTPGNPEMELVNKLDNPWPYTGKLASALH